MTPEKIDTFQYATGTSVGIWFGDNTLVLATLRADFSDVVYVSSVTPHEQGQALYADLGSCHDVAAAALVQGF